MTDITVTQANAVSVIQSLQTILSAQDKAASDGDAQKYAALLAEAQSEYDAAIAPFAAKLTQAKADIAKMQSDDVETATTARAERDAEIAGVLQLIQTQLVAGANITVPVTTAVATTATTAS